MVRTSALVRKTWPGLVVFALLVLLPSPAHAVDCITPGVDDPPGCVDPPAPTPTVTVTEFASPTATPTVTETAFATQTSIATVLPSDGVVLAPGQIMTSQLTAPQLSLIVAGMGLVVMFMAAWTVMGARGAHV